MKLYQYVRANAIRGACTCGRCIDAVANPEEHQPEGHTVDMVYFKVAKRDGATKEDFLALVEAEFPHWLDGEEHSYIGIGANMGDQGVAIMTIALGHLLGVWQAMTPAMMGVPKDLQSQMAGMGLLSMKVVKDG